MKIRSVISSNSVFKLVSQAVILLTVGLNIDNIATASTFNMQENNIYNSSQEESSDFSAKFNQDISNPLEEVLRLNYGFFEDIDLIDSEVNANKYDFQAKLNILTKSQTDTGGENLFEYFVTSLRQLEFDSFVASSSSPSAIPILPQVSYSNIYKDVYDFDVNLANSSQVRTISRRLPRNAIRTQTLPNNKYFYSYFQGRTNSNYSSFDNQLPSIKNINSSLLFPAQKSSSITNLPSVANLTDSPSVDLSAVTNQNPFSFLLTTTAGVNNADYESLNNNNSQLLDKVQPVYLPSTNIEIYQFNNFNIPSAINSYQKPEYQQKLDAELEKQREKLTKQQQKLSKQLAKIQQKREKIRIKELQKYRKQRAKELQKITKQQQKLQQQRQAQFRS